MDTPKTTPKPPPKVPLKSALKKPKNSAPDTQKSAKLDPDAQAKQPSPNTETNATNNSTGVPDRKTTAADTKATASSAETAVPGTTSRVPETKPQKEASKDTQRSKICFHLPSDVLGRLTYATYYKHLEPIKRTAVRLNGGAAGVKARKRRRLWYVALSCVQ